MKNTLKENVIALMFVGMTSMMMFAYVQHNNAKQAYAAGQIDQAMEVQNKVAAAYSALESINLPEKSNVWYPDQANSKGERHSRIRDGQGIKQFVYNNCDKGTQSVWGEVVQAAQQNGIRPEIVFAISWADSACGNALSTPNNYGNINNNDRGNRVGFFTPLAGYKAIIQTLDNKYIGLNTNIGQLSGGGRIKIQAQHGCSDAVMGYKCYATSIENWHNNIKRALHVILNEQVPNNFKFRL